MTSRYSDNRETPWITGPWFVRRGRGYAFEICAPDKDQPDVPWCVATAAEFCGYPIKTAANARLMAASPEMAELLVRFDDKLFISRIKGGDIRSAELQAQNFAKQRDALLSRIYGEQSDG